MSLSHWPERMPKSCYDSEIDDFCIAFLEEAHRSPSRSVAYLNVLVWGKASNAGGEKGEFAHCFEHTPATSNLPKARPFCCPTVHKKSQHGNSGGNAEAAPNVERVSWRRCLIRGKWVLETWYRLYATVEVFPAQQSSPQADPVGRSLIGRAHWPATIGRSP
jgi:hypothetical protein